MSDISVLGTIKLSLILGIILFLGFKASVFAKVEEPAFKLIAKDGDIELRQYSTMTMIQTNAYSSDSGGFRVLANYIFGGNSDNQKIAMTAPVLTGKMKSNQAMMMFVLPPEFTTTNAPRPNNTAVVLKEITLDEVATIRFKGYMSDKLAEKNTVLLKQWLEKNNIEYQGSPMRAQFNSPWVPGPFRRNEMWLKIKR